MAKDNEQKLPATRTLLDVADDLDSREYLMALVSVGTIWLAGWWGAIPAIITFCMFFKVQPTWWIQGRRTVAEGWSAGRQVLLTKARNRLHLPVVGSQKQRHTSDGDDEASTRSSYASSSSSQQSNGVDDVQSLPDLLGELRTVLNDSPSRLIIGHSRGGKTTLIHELATTWANEGARVLVCDPDAAPGMWPGCRVVGGGDDFEAIGQALKLVDEEVTRRRHLRRDGVRRFPPLHVVIDEAHDVVPEVPGALAVFEDLARRGGKLNMRLTIGVQDKQVKTLGLEGKSELLRNFVVADIFKTPKGRVAQVKDSLTGERVTYDLPPLLDPETLIQPRQHAVVEPAPIASTSQESQQAMDSATMQALAALLDLELAPSSYETSSRRTGSTAAQSQTTISGTGSGAHQNHAAPSPGTAPSSTGGTSATGITVEHPSGGQVVVNVQQEVFSTRSKRRDKAATAAADTRRYTRVKAYAAERRSFNETLRLVGGNREAVRKDYQRAMQELEADKLLA